MASYVAPRAFTGAAGVVGTGGPSLGPSCGMAGFVTGCTLLPVSMMPQMVPTVMPPMLAAAGFVYPAYFPAFMPMMGSVPDIFFQMSNAFLSARCQNVFGLPREAPCESSASNGALATLVMKKQSTAMYRGDTGSRSSLESSSRRAVVHDADMQPNLEPSAVPNGVKNSAAATSLCCSEVALDDGASITGARNVRFHCPALAVACPEVEPHGLSPERIGPPPQVTARLSSSPAALGKQILPDPWQLHEQSPALVATTPASSTMNLDGTVSVPPDSFAAATGEISNSPTTLRIAEARPAATATASEPLAAGLAALAVDVAARSMSFRRGGRVPLEDAAGGVMWVDARRHRAILRRRHQRRKHVGLGVAMSPRSSKSFAYLSAHNHAVRRDSSSSGPLLVAAGCPLDTHSVSDNDDIGSASGDLSEPHSFAEPMDSHHDPEPMTPQFVLAPPLTAVAAALTNSTRAALEAELQAVLAEETGMLLWSDDSTGAGGCPSVCGGCVIEFPEF